MSFIHGAAYDSDGNAVGMYSCLDRAGLEAQVPEGGRIYIVPYEAVSVIPANMTPVHDMLWEQIKRQRDTVEWAGCDTPSGRIDTDVDSQRKIFINALAAQVAEPSWSIDWTMADGSVEALDATAMMLIGIALAQHVDACHQRSRALKSELYAAETIPAAYAVVETADWSVR